MLATLIPLFNDKMAVSAYSLFTQKKNPFLDPATLGTGQFDGVSIDGLEVLSSVGIGTISDDCDIFVPVTPVSIFSDIASQCNMPHKRIVLLIDSHVEPKEMFVSRMKELRGQGYRFAMRKLEVSQFEPYREVLSLVDFVLLDHKRIDITKAKVYFSKIYPNVKLCAINIDTMDIYDELVASGGYKLFEGKFFRVPINRGEHEVSTLKVNYIQLLNMVNSPEFALEKASAVIGRDTALIIKLLKFVNTMSRNSEITSIQHAAAMLGERELKKWITAAVASELYTDKPNEVTRLSLLRARFAELLAPVFEQAGHASELFLMGLFSVLDVILDEPMEQALETVKVSPDISKALISHEGPYADIYDFMLRYENADWHEISRRIIVEKLDQNRIYEAYTGALSWYRDMMSEKVRIE